MFVLSLLFESLNYLSGGLLGGSLTSGYFGAWAWLFLPAALAILTFRLLHADGQLAPGHAKRLALGWWLIPFIGGFLAWVFSALILGVATPDLSARVVVGAVLFPISFLASRRALRLQKTKRQTVVEAPRVFGIQIGSEQRERESVPIVLGQNAGNFSDVRIVPQALLLAPSGSGKTTALRSILARAVAEPLAPTSAFAMSTKIDILPNSLTSKRVSVILPDGLSAEASSKMAALTASGATVERASWEPLSYLAKKWGRTIRALDRASLDELQSMHSEVQGQANVIVESVQSRLGEGSFWAQASVRVLTDMMLCELVALAYDTTIDHLSTLGSVASADESNALASMIAEASSASSTSITGMFAVNWHLNQNLQAFAKLRAEVITAEFQAGLGGSGFVARSAEQEYLLGESSYLYLAINALGSFADSIESGDRTSTSVVGILASAVDFWSKPSLVFRDNQFDVNSWANEPGRAVVLACPSERFRTLAPYASSLLAALWVATAKEGKNLSHLFILDEVANLTPLSELPNWVSQGRGYKNHIMAALQSEHQVEKWTKGNHATWIVTLWPAVFVASGTPVGELGAALARAEGRQLVQRQSQSGGQHAQGFSSGWSTSEVWEDRVQPQQVFGARTPGVWRAIFNSLGPWVSLG